MHDHETMRDCIERCTDCHAVCVETLHHAQASRGGRIDASQLALLQTCADICRTSADAMLRGDAAHVHTCRACMEICRLCADACDAIGDDPHMRRCAATCRSCAESCARMAA